MDRSEPASIFVAQAACYNFHIAYLSDLRLQMADLHLITNHKNLLYSLPRPVIYAHRGASRYAPENTLVAFELAIRQGADAIELDARLTADENVVVFHDETLDRVTSSAGDVSAKTLLELKALDAGSHFDIAFHGEPIPALDEVLEAVGRRIFINIELKNYRAIFNQLPEKVSESIKKHNLEHRVMFSSFNPVAVIKAKRMLPQVPIGLLALSGSRGRWARSWTGTLIDYHALHPHYTDVDAALIAKMHQKHRWVQTYTVKEAAEMQRLAALDIDGIITYDPLLANNTIRRDRL